MAVPLLNKIDGKLFFPLKTTSPSLPITKDDKLNDIKIKSCEVKAVNIVNTYSEPNFLWNGDKMDWIDDTTVVNSDFVKQNDIVTYNILKKSSFSSYKNISNNYSTIEDWNIIGEPINETYEEKKEQYKLFKDLNSIGEKYKNALSGPYVNYSFFNNESTSTFYRPEIKTKEFGDGYNLVLRNTKDIRLGIRQYFNKSESSKFEDKISFSFLLRTNTENYGVVARITFYDADGNIVDIQKTSPIANKHATVSIKAKGIFNLPEYNDWESAAFDLYLDNGSSSGPTALIRKIQLEYGENTNPVWEENIEEVSIDLNAGEIDAPMKNGEIDKSSMITHFSILRSTLSEDIYKWEEIAKVEIGNVSKALFDDYFIKNGDYYRYALQPIYANGRKGIITSYKDVVSTYEGLWILGEDNIQFNFIYNGQITNLVNQNNMEVVQTINSSYPYYVSNSDIDYRTFTIQGILCQNQDVEELFINNMFSKVVPENTTSFTPEIEDKYNLEKMMNYKTDLENNKDSMVVQRRWREQVVKWMENKKPKVIKSEAQGCIVVMIENVTVQPNKTTYGLIADFSAKCTEIGRFSEEELRRLKLRKPNLTIKDLI